MDEVRAHVHSLQGHPDGMEIEEPNVEAQILLLRGIAVLLSETPNACPQGHSREVEGGREAAMASD